MQDTTIRSVRDIKKGLLRKAFAENRGAEMIREIDSRVKRCKLTELEKALVARFSAVNDNQPKAIRAANIIAIREGRDVLIQDATREEDMPINSI